MTNPFQVSTGTCVSGGEIEDWVEHEVDELDAGAGEGQEHHPVHDPESHWNAGFGVWERGSCRRTEIQE